MFVSIWDSYNKTIHTQVCKEFGVAYHEQPTFFGALDEVFLHYYDLSFNSKEEAQEVLNANTGPAKGLAYLSSPYA